MKTFGLGALLLLFVAMAPLGAQVEKKKEAKPETPAAKSPFYGNTTCPYSGKPTKSSFFVSKGRERIYLCCKTCVKKAKTEVDTVHAKAYPKDKVTKVANKICPVMNKAVKPAHKVSWQGYEVPVCCKRCVKGFMKQPRRFLSLALDPKLTAVKNKMCPVMDDEKVVRDTFVIYRGHLIGLCCDECIDMFKDDADEYLATLGIKVEKPKGKVAPKK